MKLFGIKKCLCFTLVKNKANLEVFTELQDKLKPFETSQESCKLLFKSEPICEMSLEISKDKKKLLQSSQVGGELKEKSK